VAGGRKRSTRSCSFIHIQENRTETICGYFLDLSAKSTVVILREREREREREGAGEAAVLVAPK
jgi:hypothetical protein